MLKSKLMKTLALLLIIVSSIGMVACSDKIEEVSADQEQSQSANVENVNTVEEINQLDKIKGSGKLTIGTSADFPPYEFHKEIDGKDTIVGFDIEIAKEIAKDLGVELQIKDMKFDGLLAALDTGSIDLVLAGMTPTEDRKKNVDFSKVYYVTEQSLVIRAEDAEAILSLQDLDGKKVGVQKASLQEEIAKEQIPGAQIKGLGKISDLMLELKNNKIDALIVAKPVANAYISKNNDLMIADIQFGEVSEGSAVALKKGSPELVEAINKTLDRLIENGLIDKFVIAATESIE